jgi:uncharacterized protein (TIGR03437 family)
MCSDASDFTRVTAAKPARSGETLTLLASGLGPTRPGVDPGNPSQRMCCQWSIRQSS